MSIPFIVSIQLKSKEVKFLKYTKGFEISILNSLCSTDLNEREKLFLKTFKKR